jgi:[ribosomal protein S18]-alanine N-acetyltransferase
MIIRPATLLDLPTLLAIEKVAFPSPWTEEHFRYELEKNPYAFVMVAMINDQIVGYLDFWITFQQAQINNLAVLPSLKRKGIGQILLKDALTRIESAYCQQVTLEVRVSNLPAQTLYLKHGFKILLTKPHYYADGEDAYLMEKK